MRTTYYFIFIASVLALAASCSGTSTKDTRKDIEGNWELYAAQRNGKDIATLEGTYFNFKGDSLVSNFPIIPEIPYTVPIEVSSNMITNVEQEVAFTVEPENYPDTLHLSTMFRENEFDLMLRRVSSAE